MGLTGLESAFQKEYYTLKFPAKLSVHGTFSKFCFLKKSINFIQ